MIDPTPEQIEREKLLSVFEEYYSVPGPDQDDLYDREGLIDGLVAVAASGAAPQADSTELAWYKKAAKHSADSMAEARATLQQLADRVDQFLFDELASVLDDQPLHYETGDVIGEAAPVQVDEAKLAEVERAAAEKALLDVARMWEETAEQFGTDPEDLKIAKSSANCLRNLATQYRRNEGENE